MRARRRRLPRCCECSGCPRAAPTARCRGGSRRDRTTLGWERRRRRRTGFHPTTRGPRACVASTSTRRRLPASASRATAGRTARQNHRRARRQTTHAGPQSQRRGGDPDFVVAPRALGAALEAEAAAVRPSSALALSKQRALASASARVLAPTLALASTSAPAPVQRCAPLAALALSKQRALVTSEPVESVGSASAHSLCVTSTMARRRRMWRGGE